MKKKGWFRRLCDWGARRLLQRLHRVTHRMPVELRKVAPGRVLIVAPHMDDEVIGPGGTLALHQEAGSAVGVVYVSDSAGEGKQAKSEIRKRESEACARLMGFEILSFLDFPDGALSLHEEAIAARIREILGSWKPTVILCPFLTDHHRDHEATASAVALAVRDAEWAGEVWGFEVWSTIWPNVVVDITPVLEKKRAGIGCHATENAGMGYADAALGLNRYRGLRFQVAYGEAFHVSSAAEYVQLAERLLDRA